MLYRTLHFILLITIVPNCFAQQLEWYRTIMSEGNNFNNYPISSLCQTKDNVILYGLSVAPLTILETIEDTIYKAGEKKPELFFSVFDKKGNFLKSKVIFTANGYNSISNFAQNDFNGFHYLSFTTSSDSIKFDVNTEWHKINKKSPNTINSYIVIYDNLFNYVTYISFETLGGAYFSNINFDKSGNMYLAGGFEDSLVYKNKTIIKSKTQKKSSGFVLKISNNLEIDWSNEVLNLNYITKNIYIDEVRNSFFIGSEILNNSKIIYNDNDSFLFKTSEQNLFAISEFDINIGKLKNYFTLKANNVSFYLENIHGDKNIILLLGRMSGIGQNIIKISNDSFSFSSEKKIIIGINKTNGKCAFFNLFNISATDIFLISDIYNDSFYSIMGKTMSEQKFGFNGENIYSSDLLKGRATSLPSNFIATYSTSNRLIVARYFSTNPKYLNPTFRMASNDMPSMTASKNELYVCGNIEYHADIGLGGDENFYSSKNFNSLTLIKYNNCKPSAFFNFKINNNKVEFKNLTTDGSSLLWKFGYNNASSNYQNPIFEYPENGGTFNVTLIAQNTCGSDTLAVQIEIKPLGTINFNKMLINIYPNPASDKLFITSNNLLEMDKISIFDILGKKQSVNFIKKPDYIEASVESLSDGLYYITFIENGFISTKRLIISK